MCPLAFLESNKERKMRLKRLTPDLVRRLLGVMARCREIVALGRDGWAAQAKDVHWIVGYNSRQKIFNLFACRDWDGEGRIPPGVPGIVVEYDQETDELEFLVAAVEVAGLTCLYTGDTVWPDGRVTNLFDL